MWFVQAIDCNIKPSNFTNHKFPVTVLIQKGSVLIIIRVICLIIVVLT